MFRIWQFPVLALVGAAVWFVVRMVMGAPRRRVALESAFAGYLAALLFAVIFLPSAPRPDDGQSIWAAVNVVPLRSILGILHEKPRQFVLQVVGNVALFVPLGILLPALDERGRRLAATAAVALAVSVGIELAQLAIRLAGLSRRLVDVDDVILNVTGACVGFLLWKAARALRGRDPARTLRA